MKNISIVAVCGIAVSLFVLSGLVVAAANPMEREAQLAKRAEASADTTPITPIEKRSVTKQVSYPNKATGKFDILPVSVQPGSTNLVVVTCSNGETKNYLHNTCDNISGALGAGYCDTRGGNKSATCDYIK